MVRIYRWQVVKSFQLCLLSRLPQEATRVVLPQGSTDVPREDLAECKPQDKKKDASHKTAALSLLSFGFLMMYLLKQWQALPPHWGQVCHLMGCPQWEGLANPLLQPLLQGQWPQQAKDGILQFSNFMLCFMSFWLWTLCDKHQTIVTLTNNLTM